MSVNSDTLSMLLGKSNRGGALNKSVNISGSVSNMNDAKSSYGADYYNTPLINSLNK